VDQRAVDQRAVDQRAVDQRAVDQRAVDQRAGVTAVDGGWAQQQAAEDAED
jgi:hypothetical protein